MGSKTGFVAGAVFALVVGTGYVWATGKWSVAVNASPGQAVATDLEA